jgi:hypothetical protein
VERLKLASLGAQTFGRNFNNASDEELDVCWFIA